MPLRRRAPSLPKPASSTASYEHLPPKWKAKSVPCCANSADAWRRCAAPKLRRTRRRPRTGPRCQETMIAHRLFSQRSCLATERRKKSKHRAGEENPTSVVSLEGWRFIQQSQRAVILSSPRKSPKFTASVTGRQPYSIGCATSRRCTDCAHGSDRAVTAVSSTGPEIDDVLILRLVHPRRDQ